MGSRALQSRGWVLSSALRSLRILTEPLHGCPGEVCSCPGPRSRSLHFEEAQQPVLPASVSPRPAHSVWQQSAAFCSAFTTRVLGPPSWTPLYGSSLPDVSQPLSCSYGRAMIRSVSSLRWPLEEMSFLQYLVAEVNLPEEAAQELVMQSRLTCSNLRALEAVMANEVGMTSAQWRLLLMDSRAWSTLGKDAEVVQEILSYLQAKLMMSRAAVRKVVIQRPSLLTLDLEGNITRKVKFFQEVLGLSGAEIGQAVFKAPCLFTYSVDNLSDSERYLCKELGLSRLQMKRVVMKAPSALGFSLEDKVKVTVSFLSRELGLSHQAVGALVAAHPQLLQYSPDKLLQPMFTFFREELALSERHFRKVLTRQPSLTGFSIQKTFRPKIEFFSTHLGIDLPTLGSMVARAPSLLGMSLSDNIQAKAALLQERLDLTPTEVGKILKLQPTLLHLSVGNLEKKIDFLLTLGIEPQAIASAPAALSCSLETRIRPRYTYLRLQGLAEAGLASMVLIPTQQWAMRRQVCEDGYLRWCLKTDNGARVAASAIQSKCHVPH